MSTRHLTKTAVFVIIERDGKYLMLRRANTGWADGLLTFPTGHVDKGDMVTDACVIEVAEEVGLKIESKELELAHVVYIRDAYVQFFFKALSWSGEPTLGEPDLSSELLWIDPNNEPDDIIPLIREVLGHIATGVLFSEREDTP